jgi:biopolymer transport protein ExbD
MFFLLAAFMVVSIKKIEVKSLKVSLPTEVPVAQLEPKEDFISISINALGQVGVDKEVITDPAQLLPKFQEYYAKNKDQKFLISADKDSRNGDVIVILGKLRQAGFQRVAFALKGGTGMGSSGSAAPTPPPSSSPPTPPTPSAASTPPSPPVAPTAPTPPVAPTAPAAPTAPTPPTPPSP